MKNPSLLSYENHKSYLSFLSWSATKRERQETEKLSVIIIGWDRKIQIMDRTGNELRFDGYIDERVVAALRDNDVPKLESLRNSGISLALIDPHGHNLLHLAIRYSQRRPLMKVFEYLLTLPEINKDNLNYHRISPLECAFIHKKDDPDFAFKLIESDCAFFMDFNNGDSPLHLAVRNDWSEIAELLIEKGCEIDKPNHNGVTALHYAAVMRRNDLIWMLLFYGADPNYSGVYVCENDIGIIRKNMTFFDILRGHEDQTFLDNFPNIDKTFSLNSFVDVMEWNHRIFFYEYFTCNIRYIDGDLYYFLSRMFAFNSELFRAFVRRHGFIVEEAFQKSGMLQTLFGIIPSDALHSFCENLFILLESDISSSIVHSINNNLAPLLMHIIRCFEQRIDQMELLTQVLCCLLSYGIDMTPEAMDKLYFYFGYCDLFKMMLRMNITEERKFYWPEQFWPIIIYDMRVDLDKFLANLKDCEASYRNLDWYCTVPVMRIREVPSLIEIARNNFRKYIIRRFQIKNSMQFYTFLDYLHINEVYKNIISFRQPIY